MNPNTTPSTLPTFGAATTGFSFGATTTTSGAFGAPQFGVTGSTGFNLGAAKPGAPTAGVTPGFGQAAPSSFNFGSPATSTAPTTTSASSTGFSFPTTAIPASTVGTTPSTGFALPATSTAAPASLSNISTPAASGFSFPAPPASTATPTFSLPTPAATTTTSTGFSLPSLTTSTATSAAPTSIGSGFNLTPSTTTSGFSLGLGLTTTTSSTQGSASTVSQATTTATDTSAASVAAGASKSSVSFAQLDDTIHKWTLELVELERVFLNQMDQVRDWDRLLLSTGDKIVGLNDGMQKVKLRQQQLDHELDFIVAQQRELVDCLASLEKEFANVTVSDPERNSVYQRAENLNTQLQQISEDLKGVIEHINERNKSQDTSDPIVQIGRILNAHMNSLQWVDQNTTVIQHMLDQVGKMRDIHRRDADSTQNL